MKDIELKMYDASDDFIDTTEYKNLFTQAKPKKSFKKADRNGKKIENYIGLTPSIGGFFFSGLGYTVGTTGSLIKDMVSYLCSELPKLPYYISTGLDYNSIQHLFNFVGESLVRANYYGGIGATIGLFGGSALAIKFKNTTMSLIGRVFSIFKR